MPGRVLSSPAALRFALRPCEICSCHEDSSQQTPEIDSLLFLCWASVVDKSSGYVINN